MSVGATDIALPAPAGDFTEVGERVRSSVLYRVVPAEQRLVTGDLTASDLALVVSGKPASMDRYALVEVNRRAEYANVSPDDFRQVTVGMMGMGDKALEDMKADATDELNRRMKDLNVGHLEIGQAKPLGVFFTRKDAFGSGVLLALKRGDVAANVLVVAMFLRVRSRLLIVYLYEKYAGPETATSADAAAGKWADAILAANP